MLETLGALPSLVNIGIFAVIAILITLVHEYLSGREYVLITSGSDFYISFSNPGWLLNVVPTLTSRDLQTVISFAEAAGDKRGGYRIFLNGELLLEKKGKNDQAKAGLVSAG